MSESANQFWPIILNLVAAVVGAAGQALYQVGGLQLGSVPLWKNVPLFLGMILFCAVMVLFVVAFKMGGKLSVVYPIYATTFVWGTLIAVYFRGESISAMQIAGLVVIIAGVSLVAMGHSQA